MAMGEESGDRPGLDMAKHFEPRWPGYGRFEMAIRP
jgi:hypothetical protein